MEITFTQGQKNRLLELGLNNSDINKKYDTIEKREISYKQKEKELVAVNRRMLNNLIENTHEPKICKMQYDLAKCLHNEGFTQVSTPIIISRKFLERMSIDNTHSLNNQVFWIDNNSCLRPMLAPNLYDISKSLMSYSKLPLRIFEIGSCFRKESEGKTHLKEFTMLNLVEWGTPEDKRINRLKELANIVLKAIGIDEFDFKEENSVVYGKGLDVISKNGIELASTSMGPHKLDLAWRIKCSWVGLGFGLERLIMNREGVEGIHRYSKSISFLDGARLNIK